MKTLLITLVAVSTLLCVAPAQSEARSWRYWARGPYYRSYYRPYYRSYYRAPDVYRYRTYRPYYNYGPYRTYYGPQFYYRGPRVSVGVF